MDKPHKRTFFITKWHSNQVERIPARPIISITFRYTPLQIVGYLGFHLSFFWIPIVFASHFGVHSGLPRINLGGRWLGPLYNPQFCLIQLIVSFRMMWVQNKFLQTCTNVIRIWMQQCQAWRNSANLCSSQRRSLAIGKLQRTWEWGGFQGSV